MSLDKMVWTKWYTDKMSLDKMVRTKWYGLNGSKFWNWIQLKWNYYLFRNQKSQIVLNTKRKCKWIKVEAGLMKNHVVSRSGIDRLMILLAPFYSYHFFRTIVSATILSYNLLSIWERQTDRQSFRSRPNGSFYVQRVGLQMFVLSPLEVRHTSKIRSQDASIRPVFGL